MGAAAAGAIGQPATARATGVVKRFGPTTALDGASLTVRSGEVHALVGRNGAGKSTLVAVLTGLLAPDAGAVAFGGVPAPPLGDRAAWRRLVACVYQKTTIVPDLTVAENLYLNRQTEGVRIHWRALRDRASDLLERWEVRVDPRALARELTVEQRQLLEIARSLDLGSRFVVLDEPTAQLEAPAVARLFDRVGALQEQGVTFLFISHHLQEVFDLCQRVTVLRDARTVLENDVAELSKDDLVAAMTGAPRRPSVAAPPVPRTSGRVLLRVEGLRVGDEVRGVSFVVRTGETVGLAGIGGSGKVIVAEAVAGLRQRDAGEVEVAGRRLRSGGVRQALDAGLGYVPQDRHAQGLVPLLSVAENTTLTIPERLGSWGWIDPRRRRARAVRAIRDLDIKTDGPEQPVAALSGGNAQKVVLARALANDPRVLVLVNPTSGVDVRSKESLLGRVEEVARGGTAVLVVSDEIEDLRRCDHVLVLFEGRLTQRLERGFADHDLIAATEGVAA